MSKATAEDRFVGRPEEVRAQRVIKSAASLPEIRWASLALVLFAAGGLCQLAGTPAVLWWSLYLACYVSGGWESALSGLSALRDKRLDVDLLMIVAAVLAASIGQVFDGALLIVIFATSGAMEAFATKRTQDSVLALLELAPERATLLTLDGNEEQVDAAVLAVGDVILVRPGERVGADGCIVDGISELDQASITGEPLPVTRGVGEDVFAGTLNGAGALTVQVTRAAADTVVARIVELVETASATKAKTQLSIERIEQRYSVGVVVSALALFAVPLVFGASFEPTLLRAMTFMIVASPCAVVLATMPPLLAAIANAGRHGVLIKSAVALEVLGTVDQIAFDKTGTLTHGIPQVTEIAVVGPETTSTPAADGRGIGWTVDDIVRLAAGAERPSEHPVGRAIVDVARERNLDVPAASQFASTPGRGVSALVEGHQVLVGAPVLLARDRSPSAAQRRISSLEQKGHTVVVVIVDGETIGVIALADRVRSAAADAVRSLTDLTTSPPVLLTGDNTSAARRLAEQVHIGDVRAELLPAEKAAVVAGFKTEQRQVMFVGDGVNDAPAMATADVGVAMGRGGSDLTIQTADVILVRDDLTALATAIALARRAHRIVTANLVIAATVITVLVLWDIIATLPLPLGVAGHEGSTIVVALNGLRLLRKSAWHPHVADESVDRSDSLS